VTLGYKGRLLVFYRREQPSAHSAGELPAAPEHMAAFWGCVQAHCAAYNEGQTRLFDQVLPSLRRVASGGDGLHDWATATIGLRLPEAITPADLTETMQMLADTYTDAAQPGTTTLTFEGACPAFRTPRTNALASAFVRAIRSAGGQPGFVHKTGTSDMNVAGPAWQCPIVAYGPGDSRLDHTPNEHMILDEYQRGIAVLTHVLAHISS
jgi:LysW-gamma-L-lysine carboxypeptidase